MILQLLLALSCAPQGPSDDLDRALTAVFREEPAPGDRRTLAARLGALGRDRLEPVFDALAHGFLETDARRDRATSQERDALLGDLGRMQRSRLLHFAQGELLEDSPASRDAALRVLGVYGRSQHLQPMIDAVVDGDRGLLRTFEDSVGELLRREDGAVTRVRWGWGDAPEDVRSALLWALGQSAQPAAVDLLIEFLAWDEEDPSAVVACIDRLVSTEGVEISDELAPSLRKLLAEEDSEVLKATCLALGRLFDSASVEPMIELLEHEDRGVRGNAHWSLQRITGKRFSEQPGPWRRWHGAELRWFEESGRQVVARLRASRRELAAAALQDVQRHPLFEAEFRRETIGALAHPAPEVRELACRVVATFEGRDALPSLVELLWDRSEPVTVAAHQALKRVTNLDLEPDPSLWRAALEGDGFLR